MDEKIKNQTPREAMDELFQKLKKDAPKASNAFVHFGNVILQDGAISKRHKNLMLVALSLASQCEDCLSIHIGEALEAGASREEIIEAAMVAAFMNGGPAFFGLTKVYRELEKAAVLNEIGERKVNLAPRSL